MLQINIKKIIIFAVCIYLGYLNLAAGHHSLDSYKALRAVEHWELHGGQIRQASWRKYKERMEQVVSENHRVAVYYYLLINLLVQMRPKDSFDIELLTADIDKSKRLLLKALELAPSNPWLWSWSVHLADQDEHNRLIPLEEILVISEKYGPNEPLVQLRRVMYSVPRWILLSETEKTIVINTVNRLTERRLYHLTLLAKNKLFSQIICSEKNRFNDSARQHMCKSKQ